MSSTTATLLIAGAANLLPTLFFMFTALLGTQAVLLVLGWLSALWLARHLAHWGQARGWSTVASGAAATGGAVVAFTVLALVSTLAALLWVGA